MEQPNIIEPLNFEEIFARMKEELISRDKSFTALIESDPAMKVLEVAAWRELLLRQRINEAVRSNLLKFARGEELDNLAEFYGVERENGEKDEHFRKRIKARIVGWSTGGNYRYYALSADTRVKDALTCTRKSTSFNLIHRIIHNWHTPRRITRNCQKSAKQEGCEDFNRYN